MAPESNPMDVLHNLLDDLKPLSPSAEQKEMLAQFSRLVLDWNDKLNLTSITDPQQFWVKHIYDSLTCLPLVFALGPVSVIDIGTGAGFPGIPLRIAYPEMQLTLVESIQKKADFCRLAVEELGLSGVEVVAERAETIGQDARFRERYDWAIARAVAPLPVLLEYLLPLVHLGGHVLAQKGGNAGQEISTARSAIYILGGEKAEAQAIELPLGIGSRTLITVKKVKPTPAQFPRRAGTPKKKPLL